jgi:Mg/Co/Ni transporter MgtE
VGDAIVGVHLSARDALRIVGHSVAAVADEGKLVGIVRASALGAADPETPVGDLMEAPVAVDAEEPLSSVDELREFLDDGPVPVVDGGGRLVGLVVGGSVTR